MFRTTNGKENEGKVETAGLIWWKGETWEKISLCFVLIGKERWTNVNFLCATWDEWENTTKDHSEYSYRRS